MARLMPNVGGPSGAKRAMLMTVAMSRMLYAAPVWASQCRCNREKMQSAQRIATLRKVKAYRTISAEATLVPAGSIPADLIAGKRKSYYLLGKQELGTGELAERYQKTVEDTMTEWQNRWNTGMAAAWTKRLLLDIRYWLRGLRKFQTTFHLTQVLTGHGCFRAYLHSHARARSATCLWCPGIEEDAKHTKFRYTRYIGNRV